MILLRNKLSNEKGVLEYYVVLFELGAVKEFQPKKPIKTKYLGTDTEETIKRYCDIFGEDNVYVNLEGFPNAYDSIISVLFEQEY